MARDDFKRHEWLMRLLAEKPRSLEEIFKAYKEDAEINPQGRDFARKTFYNHRDALEQKYGVILQKDEQGRYCLNESGKEVSRRLADMWLRKITNEYSNIGGRICYQQDRRDPQGRRREPEKVKLLCQAMSGNRKVSFLYMRKDGQEYEKRTVRPYFLRMDDQRSYLIGFSEERRAVRTFCIDDRMKYGSLTLLDEVFSFPDPAAPDCVSPAAYFKDAPGVVTASQSCKPCDIIIRVSANEAKNLRSVHLFDPQEELGERGAHGEVEFRYHLAPTHEFYRQLFWHLDSVVVVEPLEVLDKADKLLRSMQKKYELMRDEFATRLYNFQ